MKKNNFLLLIISIVLLLSSFQCEDDKYYSKTIEVKNVFSIETQANYTINDLIYFNAGLPRFVAENNFATPLDLLLTTKSTMYKFSFNLFKKNNNNEWENFSINSNNFVTDKGIVEQFFTCKCILNTSNNIYEFRSGIKLTETGEYKLEISNTLEPVILNYDSQIQISINSNVVVADSENINSYTFNVN